MRTRPLRVDKLEVRGVGSVQVERVEATGDIRVETTASPGARVHLEIRPGRAHRAWVEVAPGCWRHAPWWKVLANKILRYLQTRRRPARLLVVASVCADDDPPIDPPRVTGYALRRVLHL